VTAAKSALTPRSQSSGDCPAQAPCCCPVAWSAFAHADSADRVGKGGRLPCAIEMSGPPLPTLRFRPKVIHLLSKVSLARTKQELREEIHSLRDEITRLDNKIDVLGRDLTIRMGGIAVILFGALASIKYVG
jgi:hypothetical protein